MPKTLNRSTSSPASRKELLQQELKRYLDILKNQDQPDQVILFGSLASGEIHEASDIDLIIIKHTELPFWQRLREMRQRLKPCVSVNLLVYTPAEFGQLCRERLFFQKEVLAKGKVVYERSD